MTTPLPSAGAIIALPCKKPSLTGLPKKFTTASNSSVEIPTLHGRADGQFLRKKFTRINATKVTPMILNPSLWMVIYFQLKSIATTSNIHKSLGLQKALHQNDPECLRVPAEYYLSPSDQSSS